jgi:hypothetical protein
MFSMAVLNNESTILLKGGLTHPHLSSYGVLRASEKKRDCPKSLGGACGVASRAAENSYLAYFALRIPAKSALAAALVPLFGQFLEEDFSEIRACSKGHARSSRWRS